MPANNDQPRERGGLSESDRRYLRDPDQYAEEHSRQSVSERKQAIETRVRNSLLDFTEIYKHMDAGMCAKIFAPPDDERKEFIQALTNLFAFLYRETHPTTTIPSFDYYLETGVRRAVQDMAESDFYEVAVDFDVRHITPDVKDWDELESKIRRGKWDELTDAEIRWFLRYYERSDKFDPGAAREVYEREREEFKRWAAEASAKKAEGSREKQLPPDTDE